MDLTTRKTKFKERFDSITDANLIKRFEEFLDLHLPNNEIIAHTVQGEPVTREMYIQKVKEADARVVAGKYTTHEDLLKEMQNW